MKIFVWILQIVSALILLQTLFFKFSAAEESVYIFSTIGMEPWGRIGVGISELITGILLLTKKFAWFGALMAAGIMAGAIFFHITILGIEVKGDGGYLFGLACFVFVASFGILWMRKETIPFLSR